MKIKGTGAGDGGSATVTEFGMSWDLAPGDGEAIDAALVALLRGARSRIVSAAMVLMSHPLVAALATAARGWVEVSGIYEAGQVDPSSPDGNHPRRRRRARGLGHGLCQACCVAFHP